MDSKSIARKGVPVRLRDPVLNPDETLFSSGFFCRLFATARPPLSKRPGNGSKSATRVGRERRTDAVKRAGRPILAVLTVGATNACEARRGRGSVERRKKGGNGKKSSSFFNAGVLFSQKSIIIETSAVARRLERTRIRAFRAPSNDNKPKFANFVKRDRK